MGWLRKLVGGRERTPPPGDSIEQLWLWWSENCAAIADDIDKRDAHRWIEPLSEHLHAVDDGLAWEFGPGESSRHHLAVSAEGDMGLRVVVERIISRAPAPDKNWEYYASKQPSPNMALTLRLNDSGAELAMQEARFLIEEDELRERLNITAVHEGFGQMSDADRMQAVFIVLDNLLGEDRVEKWLGTIDASEEVTADAITTDQLREAVANLEANATGEGWATCEMKTDEGAKVAVANLALKRIDHILMDVHLEVTIALDRAMPDEAEFEMINALEDSLTNQLEPDAIFIAHETGMGQRIIHYHISSSGQCESHAREWARRNSEYDIEVVTRSDPGWQILRLFG